MKMVLEIELGSDEMRTMAQVRRALARAVWRSRDDDVPLKEGETRRIEDDEGTAVGHWEVKENSR